MSRFYDNPQPIGGKYVTDESPLDDRSVVQHQADLFDPETWQNRGLYSGLLVAVIRDGENNGLYWLSHKNHFTKQMWDSSKPNYGNSGHGWHRIAFFVFDKDPGDTNDPPGSFGGDGTADNPLYINTINGGTY